jgi:hypothetical protein
MRGKGRRAPSTQTTEASATIVDGSADAARAIARRQ